MPFCSQGRRLPRTLGFVLILWLVGGALALAAPAWPAALEGRVLPVEEIEAGMRGTGYTVIQGTRVEPFDVTFLGVLPGAGQAGDLLLVQTSGPLIDRTGGIVSGMSGSPVYVDGRLVGAIAYGFSYADHRVGMVTPIGDMVKVLARIEVSEPEDDPSPWVGEDSRRPTAAVPGQVVLASDLQKAAGLQASSPEGTAVMVPLATPLMAGGFGPRTLDLLSRWAERLPGGPFLTVPTGGSGSGTPSQGGGTESFEPGSAFGVQLLRGDVDLSALGTVTWTDGERFLGFGHPFLNRGSVAFAATGASVLHTVTSVEMPFKLGLTTDLAGTLSQDRAAAVGGTLGPPPEMVEVRVDVVDLDRPKEGELQDFTFWAVNDPWLLPDLVSVGVLQALDRGIDRIGPGTARVRFRLEAEGLPEPLVRDNMFFSETDVSAQALAELLEGVDLLASNQFREVDLRSVELSARIAPDPQTAQIVSVRPETTRVRPGESILIEVELQTYRGPREKRMVRLTIPPSTPEGKVQVTVRGGYYAGPSQVVHAEILSDEESVPATGEEFQSLPEGGSLEDLLDAFRTRERNYELVAEFYPPFAPFPDEEPPAAERERSEASETSVPGHTDAPDTTLGTGESLPEEGKPVQARLATDYVIRGSDQFELAIVGPSAPQEEDPPAESGSASGS